jgi:sugar O-acyltransferase (sialic acid O-acetyltransferase NeuD family)
MRLWIIGSGGHARVVIDTAMALGNIEIAGVLDDDLERVGNHLSGIAIVGSISPQSVEKLGIEHAVIAIGSNRVRAAIAERLAGTVTWVTLVHPRAYVAGHTLVGQGTVLFAGSVLQPGSTLGHHVILNTHASVDHDSNIGDFSHIAPGAHLAGGVSVGAGAFIGLGAGVVQGRSIGSWATVGAGGVVIKDVPDRATVVGVPARVRGKE